MLTQKTVNDIAYKIIGCAIEVHKQLGPGLLESVYHECMIEEIGCSGLQTQSQVWIPLYYRDKQLQGKLVLDLLVENCVIVELKAVDGVLPVHKAQLLSYLKLTGKPKGILINFHVENIVQNAVHLVSEVFAMLPPS
ncbi:MAG: GxxExxY protein [Chitinophagaceae bacterium]